MLFAGCTDPLIEDFGIDITSPGDGSVVSGVVTVSARAWDTADVVTSVQFDLPDGTSAIDTTPPFTAPWNSTNVPDGAGRVIRATATNSNGDIATSAVTLTVVNQTAPCVNNTFFAAGLPVAIPDDNPVGISSSIPVIGSGTVASLSLSLSITHGFPDDLHVTLTSPHGTTYVVSDPATGVHTQFDNLSIPAFGGEPAAGSWRLAVVDMDPTEAGRVNGWSLAIVADCSRRAQ
jgi:subtilisin-like proprotein convertase family protein